MKQPTKQQLRNEIEKLKDENGRLQGRLRRERFVVQHLLQNTFDKLVNDVFTMVVELQKKRPAGTYEVPIYNGGCYPDALSIPHIPHITQDYVRNCILHNCHMFAE